jgi:hypothetical protein
MSPVSGLVGRGVMRSAARQRVRAGPGWPWGMQGVLASRAGVGGPLFGLACRGWLQATSASILPAFPPPLATLACYPVHPQDLMLGHEDHHFHSRPDHAFAFMNEDDRRRVQERVLRAG